MSNLIIIEGSRNVGKSYLLKATGNTVYKFPFVDYFTNMFSTDNFDSDNKNISAFHFSNGYDVASLSMFQSGCFGSTPPLMDRGFLSNVVLAVAGGRIDKNMGKKYLNYLLSTNMLVNVCIVQVKAPRTEDERNKDSWEVLNSEYTDALYAEYKEYLGEKGFNNYYTFYNDFTENSVHQFKKLLNNIM